MDSTLGSRPRHDPRFEKGAESLVNDLGKDRSVVPSRAAASLRSAESHLQVRRICSFNRVFSSTSHPTGGNLFSRCFTPFLLRLVRQEPSPGGIRVKNFLKLLALVYIV